MFHRNCRNLQLFYRNYRKEAPADLDAPFFANNIGSNISKWRTILKKYPNLKSMKQKDVLSTVEVLKKLNYNVDDIILKPIILTIGEHSVENRYHILKECGCNNVTISLLSRYIVAMNKNVATLKSLNHIPYDLDVIEKLRRTFTDVDIKLPKNSPCNENIEIKVLRQHFVNYYLEQRLDFSQDNIQKLWKAYGRIKHKSFYSLQKMIKILIEDLKFSPERISKNAFTLYADFRNVERILKEIPSINGENMQEILYKRPKIMMSPCSALMTILKHIKDHGIKEDAILKCPEVLTLGPDTILERLRDLNKVEQLQVLNSNPRILRLIHYQKKARLRLEYLNQIKMRCISLHILSCTSGAFVKFARDGEDRTRGRDIVGYLAHVLEKEEPSIRDLMSRHPNWCHIPILHIKHCYEFLLNKKFSKADIYDNVHLLLYPIKRIEEKLRLLCSTKFLQQLQLDVNGPLSNKNTLALALYLIESDYHFTGDGVWAEHYGQQVENFKNLLPDFPETVNTDYRYGVKPAATRAAVK
uniref:Transcription termination factor 5, mitochondrial n=1 Tax=Glossina brevipalpis TaxID=37001 RepID=A0A1A9X216_9MUSC